MSFIDECIKRLLMTKLSHTPIRLSVDSDREFHTPLIIQVLVLLQHFFRLSLFSSHFLINITVHSPLHPSPNLPFLRLLFSVVALRKIFR